MLDLNDDCYIANHSAELSAIFDFHLRRALAWKAAVWMMLRYNRRSSYEYAMNYGMMDLLDKLHSQKKMISVEYAHRQKG